MHSCSRHRLVGPEESTNEKRSTCTVAEQPQADRQRISQGLYLLRGFQFMILAYRPQGSLVGAECDQTGQDVLPQRVVQIARAIAGDPRQWAQGEDRVAGLAAGRE